MTTVFVDVDTQWDFVSPAGALYVPGAEAVLPAIARLNRYALDHGHRLVSTVDAHAENDVEFRSWPPHCVVGCLGQRKAASTVVGEPVVVPSTGLVPELRGAGQIVCEKQTTDIFTSRNFLSVLEFLQADRFVVYGVVTEICVSNATLGLLQTGKRVEIVRDAVRELNPGAAAEFLGRFQALGGTISSALA